MKIKHLVVTAAILAVCLIPLTGSSKLNDSDLNKQVILTQGAALLTQVDAVSLYLSSGKVAYAPRLDPDNVIDVEVTVISMELRNNRQKLKDFVNRQIHTFISVLQDRLPIYAPAIAKSFNPDTDLRFRIDEGSQRAPVASYTGGAWSWDPNAENVAVFNSSQEKGNVQANASRAPAFAGTPITDSETQSVQPKKRNGCGCPSQRD